MSTRVTDRMMSNSAKYHINQNKAYLDKLSVQESSEKKINTPSDDPVTAIRSLRFRSSLGDINQYLNRNLSDAKSWVESTVTALTTARDLMTSLKQETTSGTTTTNTISDCKTYLDEMKALVDEFYYVGNSTNEDRYLFTGYRTSDSLTISEQDLNLRANEVGSGNDEYDYIIREEFTADNISSYSFLTKSVSSADVTTATTSTASDYTTNGVHENNIGLVDCYRIRLAYDDLKATASTTASLGTETLTTLQLELLKSDGTYDSAYNVTIITDDTTMTSNDLSNDEVFYNTTTGMLIFGDNVRKAMLTASDNASALNRTGKDYSGIRFTYEKNEWSAGDLKPEHYFDCVDTALKNAGVSSTNLIYSNHEQAMNYSVGANQQIQVNINANQAFNPQVRRYIDEISDAIDAAESAETTVNSIKSAMEGLDESLDAYKNLNYLLAAAQKELDCWTNKVNSLFANGMSEVDGYYNEVNLAATESGTVQKRVELITSRLTENQATVKEQASDNENIDIADLAIDIQEADLVYQAALLVTGRINQQSLLNYI